MAGTFECSVPSGENQCCMESPWAWLMWPAGGVGGDCLVSLSMVERVIRGRKRRTEREGRLRYKVYYDF